MLIYMEERLKTSMWLCIVHTAHPGPLPLLPLKKSNAIRLRNDRDKEVESHT